MTGQTRRCMCARSCKQAPLCVAPPGLSYSFTGRDTGRSRLRRAVCRLQLDGVSGTRRLRRVRDGHDAATGGHKAGVDERSVQPHQGAAGAVRGCELRGGTSERATTIESDWNDIDGVVEYVRKLRGVAKLNLIGWSLGGPRAGGYAAQHPEKVSRIAFSRQLIHVGTDRQLTPRLERRSIPRAARNSTPIGTGSSDVRISSKWPRGNRCGARCWPPIRSALPGEQGAAGSKRGSRRTRLERGSGG